MPTVGATVAAVPAKTTTTAGGVADHESYLLCPGRQPMQIPPNHNVSRRIRLVIQIEDEQRMTVRVDSPEGEKMVKTGKSKVIQHQLPSTTRPSAPSLLSSPRMVKKEIKASSLPLHNHIIIAGHNTIIQRQIREQESIALYYHLNNCQQNHRPNTKHIIIDIYH